MLAPCFNGTPLIVGVSRASPEAPVSYAYGGCFGGTPKLNLPATASLELEQSIVAELSVTPSVVDHLGVDSSMGFALYPDQPAQNSPFPRLVYALSEETSIECLSGPTGTFSCKVELECHARSRASLRPLANGVRSVLKNLNSGRLGGPDGVYVLTSQLDEEHSGFDKSDDGSDKQFRYIYLSFSLVYRKS